MYYSYTCAQCSKVFYTYNDTKERAAESLSTGIKQHLIETDEDRKTAALDSDPQSNTDDVYYSMGQSNEVPSGGYEIK